MFAPLYSPMILISAASRAVFADNGNGACGLFWPLMEFGACHNGSHPTLWHSGLLKQPDIKLRIPSKCAPPSELEPWLWSQPSCKWTWLSLEPSLLRPSVAALPGSAQKPASRPRITLAQTCPCPAIPHTPGIQHLENQSLFKHQ